MGTRHLHNSQSLIDEHCWFCKIINPIKRDVRHSRGRSRIISRGDGDGTRSFITVKTHQTHKAMHQTKKNKPLHWRPRVDQA